MGNGAYRLLRDMEFKGEVISGRAWRPLQGRHVGTWFLAPPGTVPPPLPAPDPAELGRKRERDTAAQRARRAARRAPSPGPAVPDLTAAACRTADPDLFFGSDREFVTARQKREAEAKAVCAGCPVRDACLAYALDSGQDYGIWGGLTEDERRALLRQRRAS
jgi:WhiB family redox-sensing transcriptional regulator